VTSSHLQVYRSLEGERVSRIPRPRRGMLVPPFWLLPRGRLIGRQKGATSRAFTDSTSLLLLSLFPDQLHVQPFILARGGRIEHAIPQGIFLGPTYPFNLSQPIAVNRWPLPCSHFPSHFWNRFLSHLKLPLSLTFFRILIISAHTPPVALTQTYMQ